MPATAGSYEFRLYVNNVFQGLYSIVESVDTPFLSRVYGTGEGYLFEFKYEREWHGDYLGDDLDCKPHVYTKDMTFVDPGGDHIHILRNEGKVVAQTIVVQLIPARATRRIDVADPGNCHF